MALSKLIDAVCRWRARRRKLARLVRALPALPAVDRFVYILCTAGRLPQTEVARQLGLTRIQVEQHLARALVALAAVLDGDERRERALFEKLTAAYVKARYSKHYRITADELAWLFAQVEELGRAVHAVCSDRLATLRSAATP